MLRIIFCSIIGLTLASCDPLSQPPSKENVGKALEKFYQDSSKYDKSQIQFMEGLTALLESEEKFEEDLKSKVTTESYDSVTNNLTEYFNQNDYNYYYLLNCETIAEELNKQEKKELESVAEEIDKECQKRQAEIDRIDKILDNAMTTKLTRLRTDYNEVNGSFVEFRVVDTNHSGKTISGRKVLIEFYDGFNKLVHFTNLKGSTAFRNTEVGYLSYYKDRDEEAYNKFANMKLSSFRIVTKNKTLNIDGEIIAYPSWTNINFDHKSSGTPSTYCPYIRHSENEEPLQKKVDSIKEKYAKKLKEECEGFSEMVSTYLPKIKSE